MPRPRVTTRKMMLAVAAAALAFAVLPMSTHHTWWEIKPFLILCFLPLIAVVFSLRSPRPSTLWTVAIVDLFLLSLWFLARRTLPNDLFDENILRVFEILYLGFKCSLIESLSASCQYVHYYCPLSGAYADLATLGDQFIPARDFPRGPVSRSLRLVFAGLLGLARLYDWITSVRLRHHVEGIRFDPDSPLRLFQSLIAGNQTHTEIWSKLGWVMAPLEFITLAFVLLYLLTVAISILRRHRGEGGHTIVQKTI